MRPGPCSTCTISNRVLHQRCAEVEGARRGFRAPRLSAAPRCELERAWLPRFSQLLDYLGGRRRTGARALRPAAQVTVYPNAIPLTPRAGAAERGRHRLLRQHGVSPQPLGGALLSRARSGRYLRERWPGLVWRLVGKNPDGVRQFTAGDPRIEVPGQVDDAVRELARARVAVVPLLAGSGTRLKILEAWAAGLPVVSTTIGAEGLPACDGEHLSAGRRGAGLRRGGVTAVGVHQPAGDVGHGWQVVAGKGVYMGDGLEEVGLLTQPGVIMVRYTGTVNAFCR